MNFGTVHTPAHAGKPWSAVTGAEYVASPANIGAGAPQGWRATPKERLDGGLLSRLRSRIESTGGKYSAQ